MEFRGCKWLSKCAVWGFLLVAMLVCACSRSDLDVAQVGTISFTLTQDDAVNVKSSGTERIYALDIVSEQGDTVVHYDDHRTVQTTRLQEGVYTVYASENKVNSTPVPFGEPRYEGQTTFTVTAGANTPVALTCKLSNIKVTVLAFDQEIIDNFTDYSLVIKPSYEYAGSDSLTFTQTEVDVMQEGWIDPTPQGTFVLIFRAFNHQSMEKRQTYVRTIADAQPADFYRFTVKMNPTGDPSDGGAMFRLSVQTDAQEYEFPFGVKEQTRAIPQVTRADGGSIYDPLITNVESRNGVIRLNIHADASMQRLRIRHEDADVLLKYGLPGMITLGGENDMATDEALRTELAHLVTWGDGTIVGNTDTWIDFSGLMNTATLDGTLLPEGNYTVDIEVYDFDNQMVTQTVNLAVARDFSTGVAMQGQLVNGLPGVGAIYAYVTAQWLNSETPAGLGFQYRPVGAGEDAWQTVLVSETDIDVELKTFRGLLSGLTPQSYYEVRPVGTNVSPGAGSVFQTEAQVEIPNLDFEGGQYGAFDGASDVYDPNIPGQNRFWATGNPGGKYTVLGQGLDKNVTLPVEGAEARTGKALWMTSYYVDKFGVRSLASGTIFSGTFGPISSAPTNSDAQRALVHYGQPYVARPVGLKGWYKYIPKTIDTDIDNKYPDLIGQSDQCKIYISLEKWGTGATSRPANPIVVGYGELLSGATTGSADQDNGYVPFEFKIMYQSSEQPDHIVMCATCSYLSDDFCGGAGSTLYIDDFEVIWNPNELTQ